MSYEIHRLPDKDGQINIERGECIANNERLTVKILPHKSDVCWMKRRHRIDAFGGGGHTQIIVARIDDVFLYVDGDEITMTKKVDI